MVLFLLFHRLPLWSILTLVYNFTLPVVLALSWFMSFVKPFTIGDTSHNPQFFISSSCLYSSYLCVLSMAWILFFRFFGVE